MPNHRRPSTPRDARQSREGRRNTRNQLIPDGFPDWLTRAGPVRPAGSGRISSKRAHISEDGSAFAAGCRGIRERQGGWPRACRSARTPPFGTEAPIPSCGLAPRGMDAGPAPSPAGAQKTKRLARAGPAAEVVGVENRDQSPSAPAVSSCFSFTGAAGAMPLIWTRPESGSFRTCLR